MTEPTVTGVRWISSQPGDGFGDAALGYVQALDALGVPVTWTPVEWVHNDSHGRAVNDYRGPAARLAGRSLEHDTVVFHLPLNGAVEWLSEAHDQRPVAFTTWETDRIPKGWDSHCGAFERVLVPSTFNRHALVASGARTQVRVVPHCARRVDTVEPARYERIGDRFVFYTIGTWSTRKAIAETVSAFLDAFDQDDDVALVVKTAPANQQQIARARRGLPLRGPAGALSLASWPAFAALLAGRRNVPEIHLISDQVPARDIDALHARGDCFLSLTRAEGYGLCIADALLFGNPVVVTGWGGHLDYLGGDYPLLVDYDLVPTSSDVPDDWFDARSGYRWAKARHDHAVDLLRWVAEHRHDARALGQRIGSRLARECAPDVIGRRLLSCLQPM